MNHSVNRYLFTRVMIENTRNSAHTQRRSSCREPILLRMIMARWHIEDLGCVSNCANRLILRVNLEWWLLSPVYR